MAVRVTGATGEASTYDHADSFDAGADDHLLVTAAGVTVAVFHRNHWSKAEFIAATAEES